MILKESGMHKSQKNHRKMEEPGVVVEGFGDTDETYSDLQDESVTLVVEMLILPCIEFGREGPRRGADSNAICTCFLLKFVSPISASGLKKPQRRFRQQDKRQR
jgi:hypothetical protein